MTVVTTRHLDSRPFTVDDLEAMPDDGHRYELLDGVLIVSPAPGTRHQVASVATTVALDAACPAGLVVLAAPYGVQPSRSTELQPDVLVARVADLTEKNLPVAPLLVIELLSPSTALYDLNLKKAAYQRMGIPSYWVLDAAELVLTVFELDASGKYQQTAEVKGDEPFIAERPFAVRIVPARLLSRLGGADMSG
jgi:Uma2 family endonuclease